MDLRCIIKQTNIAFKNNFYIVIQYKQQPQKNYKFRTDISRGTDKPKFYKNLFQFPQVELDINLTSIKFGLFSTNLHQQPSNQKQLLDKSVNLGIATLKFSYNLINQLQQKGFIEHSLLFVSQKKQIGRVYFALSIHNQSAEIKHKFANAKLDQLFYNPFEQDIQTIKNNVKKLEQVLQEKNRLYEITRQKLGNIRSLQQKLLLDQKNLRQKIERLEKQNYEMHKQLNQKMDKQVVKTQIQLLKGSSKGQQLLLKKLYYIKQRIKQQDQQNYELSKKYKILQPQIKNQIKIAARYTQLQKGIKAQQFQIQRNQNILKTYNELVERIRTNQTTIQHLKQMSKKSELTAKQALIILQQVRYEAHLNKNFQQKQIRQKGQQYEVLQRIQKLMNNPQKQSNEVQYAFTYEVKLQALLQQIKILDEKIRQN